MTHTALILIDLVSDSFAAWEDNAVEALAAKTNALTRQFRMTGQPVLWVQNAFAADLHDAFAEMRQNQIALYIEGTTGAAIHPAFEKREGDHSMTKKRYSAFFGTELDAFLETHGVETLILAGVNTHACIRMTAIDAYQRDLNVILALDALGSYDAPHARMSLDYMDGKIATGLDNEAIAALG